jgi:hypothetical protein
VHLFESAVTPPMTNEQRIRGVDAGVDWAIFVTGYNPNALAELAGGALGASRLAEYGATGIQDTSYRFDYALSHDEIAA